MPNRSIYRFLCLAAMLAGCASQAQSPALSGFSGVRSVYPGMTNLDERGIATLVRQRVRLPERPSAAMIWTEEGPARSRHERDTLTPELTAGLEGAPLAWVQAVPSALVPASGESAALDLRSLRSAGAHFQSDLVLLVQTEVSEEPVMGENLIEGVLYLVEFGLSPVRRVVATASAEVCAVDVRTGVMVACGQGSGPNSGHLTFVLTQASAQQQLTREALLGAVRSAGEQLRLNLVRARPADS
jgi:hypothetical protein